MHVLRHESLNHYNPGKSSHQLYSKKTIMCRRIKEEINVFNLTIHNSSPQALTVAYAEMKGIRYSNRIEVVSWGNQPNIEDYQGFYGHQVRVLSWDLNFGILGFLYKDQREGKINCLAYSFARYARNNSYQYSFKGSIILSQSFSLGYRNFTTFLGGFKFPAAIITADDRIVQPEAFALIQRLRLLEPAESDGKGVVNWQQGLVELNFLCITKNKNNQYLAKIMLYLIFFLKNQ